MRAIIALTPFTLALALAATALTGCGDKAKEDGATTPATSAAAPDLPATPTRAEGLWQQTVDVDGGEARVSKVCIDKAAEAKLSLWGGQIVNCSKNEVKRNLTGGYAFASVCDLGSSGVTTASGEAKGDFAKKYEVNSESSITGAAVAAMNGTHKTHVVAERIGDCPAGWRGGDVEIPGGIKINLIDAMAAMPPPR